MLQTLTEDDVMWAALILGDESIDQDEMERRLLERFDDPITVRRLADCIPEAFGLVLISQIGTMHDQGLFGARNAQGKVSWAKRSIEPVFALAKTVAQKLCVNGQHDVFSRISLRSAAVNSINDLLNAGGKVDGTVYSGPVSLGIPAEIYPQPPPSGLARFLGWWKGR